jgi:hypothetical protein
VPKGAGLVEQIAAEPEVFRCDKEGLVEFQVERLGDGKLWRVSHLISPRT